MEPFAINSDRLASTFMDLMRIDHETTCNIGCIHGGTAINIVPDRVVIEVEVRSHDAAKLDAVTANMVRSFVQAMDDYIPLDSGHDRSSASRSSWITIDSGSTPITRWSSWPARRLKISGVR